MDQGWQGFWFNVFSPKLKGGDVMVLDISRIAPVRTGAVCLRTRSMS